MTLLYYNQSLLGADYDKHLHELPLATPDPISVNVKSRTIKAYQAIVDNHVSYYLSMRSHSRKVSAVAVVDDEKKLVCTLSASDVKGLGQEDCKFSRLLLNVDDYFIHRSGKLRTPVTCTMNNTLGTVLSKVTMFRIHRVWITDDNGVLSHVISLSDIISHLVQNILSNTKENR
jgi:CBS-domain-containing membrane protein